MKAVLDSSVLVSAFLSPGGPPAALIANARGRLKLGEALGLAVIVAVPPIRYGI
jgi:hypothetical protein